MRRQRPSGSAIAALLAAGAVALAITSLRAAPQQRPGPAPSLPPLSMTCPMHADVVEAVAGTCPLCKMNLVPVRLGLGWTCPVHAVVNEDQAGTCRLCGRALVQATVALTWTCRGESAEHLEPGLCTDGSPRVGKRTLRPHGNHNPKYGGQFFMAPDNWHHLEGTLPRARLFRLYVYDDYARALPPEKLRGIRGRVVTRETYDARTRTSTEVTSVPLRMTRDDALEARIDVATVPAAMTAKVRFAADTPEYRFDFTFTALTVAPAAAVAGAGARAGTPTSAGPAPRATGRATPSPAGRTPASTVPGPTPAGDGRGAPGPADGLDPLVPVPVPETVPERLAHLRARQAHVAALVARGDFGSVWVPAFQAKDVAIALEADVERLGPGARDAAEPALQDLVRAAWHLDTVGDLGNRQQVEDAFAAFSRAVAAVLAAFEGSR